MTKKITIPPPDAATILAARHLDAEGGPVYVGDVISMSTRRALDTVLRYIAMAHNAPATEPEICELPHESIEEEDECERQRQTTPCGPAPDSCEPGAEPCARHEREQAHADGEHELCGPGCGATDPALLKQALTRAVFALKTPSPDGSSHYQGGWDDALEAAIDAVAKVFDTLD